MKIDVRLVERNLANGTLDRKEYEKHLKSLSDDENNGEWVSLDLEETEISENPTSEIASEIASEISSDAAKE